VAAFREAGLEVQTQQAQVSTEPSRRTGSSLAWVENVMARLKGTEGGGAVMLATHYDSAGGSPGAADAGAGVASLVEAARGLKAGPPLRHDVVFLVTDAEELGLLGAQAFVLHHPWGRDVKRVLNFEARGTGGPVQMFEATEGNADLIQVLATAWPHPTATSLAFEVARVMPNSTDMAVFRRANLRGLGFAFVERPWDYHHPTDHVAQLDEGSLQQMGEAALGLARGFGNADLGPGSGRNTVYFNLLGFHLVRYPAALVPWLSLLGLGLTLGALVRAFRREGLTLAAWGRALGLLLLSLLVAVGLGLLLGTAAGWVHGVWGVKEIHPSYFQGQRHALLYNPWYLLLPVALAGLLAWALPKVIRNEATRAALPAAGWTAWALVAVGLSFALPGASYLVQWPWLLTVAGTLLAPRRLWTQVPALLVLILLLGPHASVLGTALGFTAGLTAALAVWLLLAIWLQWPVVSALGEARLLLLTSAVLLLTGLVGGGLWARSTFRNRVFANIEYAVNLDSGKAWWVAQRAHEGPWTRRFLDHPLPNAPSWEGDGRLRPAGRLAMIHQEAPLLEVPRPGLALVADTTRDGLRTLRLAVTSAGAEEVRIVGEDGRFCRGAVEGHLLANRPVVRSVGATRVALEPASYPWRLTLQAPPSASPVEVELTFTSGVEPLRIGLQARYGSLPAALGERAKPIPGIQPIESGNCTWVGRVLEVK
jgi:hypothetical protein